MKTFHGSLRLIQASTVVVSVQNMVRVLWSLKSSTTVFHNLVPIGAASNSNLGILRPPFVLDDGATLARDANNWIVTFDSSTCKKTAWAAE